ncbi:hypothetical protein CFC21_056228 [Triticum aestivum]|uniref:RecQ-mediated genome instability protein 2 n=2 Tax=Triticum aestivum TaxID=4565 RepID=A0A9R1GGU4_WHEAT|nr:uncharacterized protein LOC123090687 [Triticum aestivum]KAF7047279.1 hypothetical protein CFC21_056225 [Triticum aestivum]KAF7047283.1 hypothetical protein CFC21_056228 [Triticum aestivum]
MEGRPRGGGGGGRTAMDYSLAALKLLASQLAGSTTAPSSEGSSPAQMLFGIRFQRAWIQGVVVRADYSVGDGRLFVDDGSCVTELMLRPEDAKGQPWRPGMYVLIIGAYIAPQSTESLPMVKVHKIVDLSAQPDREAMWYMEVAEAYNFFYKADASGAGSPP